MFNTLNINGLEIAAQFSDEKTWTATIWSKPNVSLLQIDYKGKGEFAYFAIGKTKREISRDFANDILMQEEGRA